MSDNQLVSDPAADPTAAVDPAVAAAPLAPQDPQPPADPAAPAHGNAGKTPWYMIRINEETNRRNEERAGRETAERRARDAEELLARLQQGDKPPGQQPPTAPRASAPNQDQYVADVQREAARMRLYEDSTAVKSAGIGAFGSTFNEALATLTAVGATSDDFVLDVLAVDRQNAHVILDTLAKDPERAAALAGMDSRRRISELTRMAMTDKPAPKPAAEPKPAAVSKAPPPKPAIEPSAPAHENDWMDPEKLDKMTEAEANAMFSRQWDAKYAGRKSA